MYYNTREREREREGDEGRRGGEGGGERDIVTGIERQFPNELV